ncbi:MAG: hypothetical protein R3E86_04955 [Pseudomonadales bacterium]
MRRVDLLLVGVLLLAGAAAMADERVPAPACDAPVRPADDQNDVLWRAYLDAVDRYRACISEYAAANWAASEAHSQAANTAVAQWNAFVRDQLNVPEDYPWPPRQR